jgi:hypothetical protein
MALGRRTTSLVAIFKRLKRHVIGPNVAIDICSGFTNAFKRVFSLSPREYKEKHNQSQRIRLK